MTARLTITWSSPTANLLILVLLWCASLILINPIGNFPLNDDWSFALVVKNLLESHVYRPTGWSSMPLITNVVWGSLFCIPGDFSFDALRLSTLTASLLGFLAVYFLSQQLRLPRWPAIVAALTLAFNPIYYALSNTFMTDVLYTTLQLFAVLFFVRFLRGGSNSSYCLGIVIAIAATLSRQLAIAIPIAFALATIFRHGITLRSIIRATMPLLSCVGALLLFQHWLEVTDRLPTLYYQRNDILLQLLAHPKTLLVTVLNCSYVALLYLGLFLLPVLFLCLAPIWIAHKNKTINIFIYASIMGLGTAGYTLFSGDPILPVVTNVIIKSGIGPLTLQDTNILGLSVRELPDNFWLAVTAAGLAGAALLIISIAFCAIRLLPKFRPAKMDGSEAVSAFLLLSAAIYLVPILCSGLFDRYLVPPLPLLALGILSVFPRNESDDSTTRRLAVGAVIAGLAIFSICGTRDYLTWNRIRWLALHELMQSEQIGARDIDGGFEFNGLYLYNEQYRAQRTKSWWWVERDTYLIGFHEILGYTKFKEYKYSNWMPPHTGTLLVLKKSADKS